MQSRIKSIFIHFGIAIIFAVLVVTLTDLFMLLPIDMGWHFLTILYILIISGQIAFYYLTTYTQIWLTILSFSLNFVLWITELANLERFFHNTFFYQDKNFKYVVVVLGGILWAINKLIIDRLFILWKISLASTNKADFWTKNNQRRNG